MIRSQRTDPDHVYIFVTGQPDHGIDVLPGRGVNHFHAGIPQSRGNDTAASVVTVQANFGDQIVKKKLDISFCF